MPVNIFTTIDDPLATQDTDPFGINGSGQIVGAFRTNSVFHGFVLSGGSFTTLDAPWPKALKLSASTMQAKSSDFSAMRARPTASS
jgi:hypothetical protein